jgi:hypothetical protein
MSEGKPTYPVAASVATGALVDWIHDLPGGAGLLQGAMALHIAGNWGGVEDPEHNDENLLTGGQLLSVWQIAGRKVWVISDPPDEHGARVVTALFPEDY